MSANAALGEHCAAALVCYMAGVGAGSSLAQSSGKESRLGTFRLSLLLTAETVLLAAYAAWWMADNARPEGGQQLILLGAVTFAMGLQGAAVGISLLETAPDLAPLVAVAGVLFTAGVSWDEHRHAPRPTTSTPRVAQPLEG